MAYFSRTQALYTDGAYDNMSSKKGGCGYAFFSASLGRWLLAGWSLGKMQSIVDCELLALLAAMQHAADNCVDTKTFILRTESTDARGRITAAREGRPLYHGARTATIVNRILGEIELLEFRGVEVRLEYVKAHSGVEGNELADMMA
ncbi:uncharacterized protein CLAFUR5_05237 [Fulvia fulva]|uniref:RNase H type-1 domain-containing protein n=1 Tax=Passalora fulva TaxID=5499 RepID=A0A9Q8LI87_PASFU|nr:uncharacterized protein CLAFUR5_05237 [Fulvia fulva]KAK4616835.1 hypothetical protein CLAFUR0_10615 [Fulvia fulva]UJO17093.1 hypothetical protein CLAFUR5_05237 [Fulvia fulva]